MRKMSLFAVKCRQGYLKEDKIAGLLCVDIHKASVFDQSAAQKIEELMARARESGLADVRKVELLITETDPLQE